MDVGAIYNGASELKELLAELTIRLLTYSGRLVFAIFGPEVWIKGGRESLQLGDVCFGETPLRWADLEQGKIPAKKIELAITSVDRSLTFESFWPWVYIWNIFNSVDEIRIIFLPQAS